MRRRQLGSSTLTNAGRQMPRQAYPDPPQIRLTQSAPGALNAADLFWLPVGDSYGNLLTKLAWVHQRVTEINRRLSEAFAIWTAAQSEEISDAAARHLFSVEHVIFQMRRAAAELIGLRSVVSHYANFGEWPRSVDPDCVGGLLGSCDLAQQEVYRDHEDFLNKLNDLSNAQKHSFLNSDTTLFGRDEPTANALHRKRNRANSPMEVYGVSLRAMACSFECFCLSALTELRDLSAQIQNRQASNSDPGDPGTV